ncbi:hypothetical protein O7626_07710 [Micromonospora sp. WMMD1102]|uniref:hypothetical protein n=1 Tax=Micromonospora sp. WMMD1102 TaxID=3016105 RepID=UPI00241513D7|nr:hypothetical protein [Micromonospora sp. WMMD1102]MDG4785813.1 hypothetical protein [Micromonospora sp. WMMD1102]
MAGKKRDPDTGSGVESSERGRGAAGAAVAGMLLVAVLALSMVCIVLLLKIGVPLWPAVVVVVVLCLLAVVVVRRVTVPASGAGRDGWAGRLLKLLVLLGAGPGSAG